MWTWADEENMAAVYIADSEPSIFCGINMAPLAGLLAEGLLPEMFVPNPAR
jgi:hypothetical protein